MKVLLLEAMAAGAVGFATSTLEQHNGENGIPMPSRLADEHALPQLTGPTGPAGWGGCPGEGRASETVASARRSTARWTRFAPMNPAPPVTSGRTSPLPVYGPEVVGQVGPGPVGQVAL